MTLGVGSRIADKTYRVHIDDVYGTMFDFQEAHGVLPEVAAAHGLEAARQLARAPGLEDATIVAVLTGANPDEYKPGYLEAMSRRRAGKPGMG
jgi:threonine dehydratase